jgi:hypothetical protein
VVQTDGSRAHSDARGLTVGIYREASGRDGGAPRRPPGGRALIGRDPGAASRPSPNLEADAQERALPRRGPTSFAVRAWRPTPSFPPAGAARCPPCGLQAPPRHWRAGRTRGATLSRRGKHSGFDSRRLPPTSLA